MNIIVKFLVVVTVFGFIAVSQVHSNSENNMFNHPDHSYTTTACKSPLAYAHMHIAAMSDSMETGDEVVKEYVDMEHCVFFQEPKLLKIENIEYVLVREVGENTVMYFNIVKGELPNGETVYSSFVHVKEEQGI